MLLAKGKKKEAVEEFQGILLTAGLLGIGLALAGNLFLPQILSLLGTVPEDGILYEAAGTYAGIILGGIPLFFLAYISNYYLRNDDCQRLAGVGFTIGNLSDIGLNFLLVWGLDLGVAGAAWATLAGQAVSIGCYLTVYWKKNRCLRLFPFTPRFQTCFSSFRAGFASSSQYLYSMLFLLTANRVLMEKTGSLGPAVFDLVQNASFFLLYLYEGTARAAQPVISTYTGEKDEEGRRRVRKNALFFGSLTGLCGILLVAFFPRQVCALFGMKEAGEAGVYALQVYCTGAGIAGINLLLESYEQACGREKGAFVMTTLREMCIRDRNRGERCLRIRAGYERERLSLFQRRGRGFSCRRLAAGSPDSLGLRLSGDYYAEGKNRSAGSDNGRSGDCDFGSKTGSVYIGVKDAEEKKQRPRSGDPSDGGAGVWSSQSLYGSGLL